MIRVIRALGMFLAPAVLLPAVVLAVVILTFRGGDWLIALWHWLH